MTSGANDTEHPRDERAARREQRRQANRERMQKHGATTAAVYRNAVLKRLQKKAGAKTKTRRRQR